MVVPDSSGLTSYSAAREKFYKEDGSDQPEVSTPVCFASFKVDSDTHVLQPDYFKVNPAVLSMPGYSASGVIYVLFELDYNFDLVTGFVNNHASDFSGRLDKTQNLEFNDENHKETLQITVSAD